MPIPLDLLVDQDCNVYELTMAMIRRAMQITITGDADMEAENEKVVSTAITQILTKKVEYKNES
ncbi:MAG: DNA-directed RNA polymerase subunit omega [Spirochaetales bacterium]|nr:DNA-directed RNA polymerase subunit omega [Spirochaetales bacterium]